MKGVSKINKTRNSLYFCIGITVAFCISYLLCRFALFDLHGMKQWPLMMGIVGLFVGVVASVFKKRTLALSAVLGYIGGFVFAMLFNTDGTDLGGGRTNNAWVLWIITFTAFIVIGTVLEIIVKRKNN